MKCWDSCLWVSSVKCTQKSWMMSFMKDVFQECGIVSIKRTNWSSSFAFCSTEDQRRLESYLSQDKSAVRRDTLQADCCSILHITAGSSVAFITTWCTCDSEVVRQRSVLKKTLPLNILTCLYTLPTCLWTVEGNWSTHSKPTTCSGGTKTPGLNPVHFSVTWLSKQHFPHTIHYKQDPFRKLFK